MRRISTGVAIMLFVAACGGPEGGESTTSLDTAATATSSTSSTVPPVVTTTLPATTTTLAATTTTSIPGNWADEPLVVSAFGALGWWDGSKWVQVVDSTTLPVTGGEDYRVVLQGLNATLTGGPQVEICEPLQNQGVELSDPEVLGDFPGPFGLAISAPWDLVPHFVQAETDDGTYSDFARPLLAARGIDVAHPVIKQVVRVDLEGDGVNEVVVVAEDIEDGGLFAQEGDYSLAFLRKVVDGEVQTGILGDSVVSKVEEGVTPFVLSFHIPALADLSGDGKIEIVVTSRYYEGLGFGVWEYVNDDLGAVLQIEGGCGA